MQHTILIFNMVIILSMLLYNSFKASVQQGNALYACKYKPVTDGEHVTGYNGAVVGTWDKTNTHKWQLNVVYRP